MCIRDSGVEERVRAPAVSEKNERARAPHRYERRDMRLRGPELQHIPQRVALPLARTDLLVAAGETDPEIVARRGVALEQEPHRLEQGPRGGPVGELPRVQQHEGFRLGGGTTALEIGPAPVVRIESVGQLDELPG